MKTKSDLRRLTAALLSCILCCTGMAVPAFSVDETEELPARFDWREEAPEILTPVKKQVGGTCWAHATIGCIESNLILKGLADNSIDLSEAHLIWFTEGQGAPTDPDDPRYGSGKNLGVQAYSNGVHCHQIIASLAAWQGAVNEDDVPPHSEKPVLDESLRYNSAVHLQNARYFYYVKAKDMPLTKQMVKENGPLYLTFFNDHDHKISEKSGYYNPDYSDQKLTDGELDGSSHAVMIVGWDDHYPKDYFNDEAPEDGAWILRNSAGNYNNSDNGYFYMSYFEPSIAYIASFDCESATNYGSNRSYHGTDIKYSGSPGGKGYYTANVFEAEKDEKIAAAGYFRLRSNLGSQMYEISVYILNPDASDPQDGSLVFRKECTEELSGFYTVKFPESISVEKGQKYSVVLKTPIGYGTYFDGNCYKKGVSYYAYYTADSTGDQQNWKDCYENELGDACLHVYTEYEGETEQFIRGDLNRDGKVNAVDLTLLKQVLLGSVRTDIDQKAADWNRDEAINAEDAKRLLGFLLGIPEQGELKIKLTGSTAGKRDEAFRRQMQNAVLERVPDFDFSQFTFETNGMTYLHDKNDATEEIGKQFYFRIYYQDILLDPEQYELHIQQYYDGRFETNADFLTADMQEKLTEAVDAPRIAEADAVSAAREYAASLDLPDLPSVRYQPSERFGEKTALLVYSLAEGRLAYRVTDLLGNCYELGTGQSAVLCAAAADVYVDAVTGAVLENRFITTRSVS